MANVKIWPFFLAAFLVLTATVMFVPERGNKRFYGFGLAVLCIAPPIFLGKKR